MKKIYISLILIFGSILSNTAQENDSHSLLSSWNSITPKVSINDQFYAKSEFHVRRTNVLKIWEQLVLRPSMHYKLNSTYDFSVGYSFLRNYAFSEFSVPINVNEHNVWEQVALSHKEGQFGFNHRFRFEQRFIDNIISQTNGNFSINGTSYANRFRYRFTILRPIFKLNEGKFVSFKFFDEIFLSLDHGLEPINLNQNWLYLGLTAPITRKISMALGYQHIGLTNGNEVFISDEIIATSLSLTL